MLHSTQMPSTIGTITILVRDRDETAAQVNEILSQFAGVVIGRMGIPYSKRNLHIITLVVDATTDAIGALTGRLGQINDVTVKSSLAKLKE